MAITFDEKKLAIVPAKQVKPNNWNPKGKDTEEYRKIRKGIDLKGLRQPIIVRETKPDHYEIIDGEQRWTAAAELGMPDILIYNEGKLSDQEARELTIWYQQQVPFEEVPLAKLVAEMMEEYGVDTLELPYDEAELQDFKDLAGFSSEDLEDDDDDEGLRSIRIVLTAPQYAVVRKALDHVIDEDDCTDGQAIERIAADFLSGA